MVFFLNDNVILERKLKILFFFRILGLYFEVVRFGYFFVVFLVFYLIGEFLIFVLFGMV